MTAATISQECYVPEYGTIMFVVVRVKFTAKYFAFLFTFDLSVCDCSDIPSQMQP